MSQRKGSAAVARATPRSADLFPAVSALSRRDDLPEGIRGPLRRALKASARQLRHDAELVELHAGGVAPERALELLLTMRQAIDQQLASAERAVSRLRP